MSKVEIPGLVGEAPTKNEALLHWIADAAKLLTPDEVVFADGSREEWDRVSQKLVDSGTLIRLNDEKRPNSWPAPTPLTWLGLNHGHSFAQPPKKAPDPPTTGSTRIK